jgi:hypothetical protein
MAVQAAATTIACFPSQQAITDYFATHPYKKYLDDEIIKSKAPNGIQKVADFFANKQIPSDQVNENVINALDVREGIKSMAELGADVAKLTGDWEKIDKGNANHHTNTMKDIHAKIALLGAQLKLVVKIYDVILNDLLDNATYTPPPPEGKEWTRHVGVVTRRVKE